MVTHNDRAGGNRHDAGGGRPKFGGNRFGKPGFAKKSWGDKRSDDRPVTMHKATCANCNRTCEVPFRPNGEKPVYCKDCFANKNAGMGNERNAGRDTQGYAPREYTPRGTPPHYESNKGNDDIKRQLEAVNAKLERLIQAVEKMTPRRSPEVTGDLKDVIATAIKKNPKKSGAKK